MLGESNKAVSEKLILEQIIAELTCPISGTLPRDSVILLNDGHLYSRQKIMDWLNTNPSSPMTRELIEDATVFPVRVITNVLALLLPYVASKEGDPFGPWVPPPEAMYLRVNINKEKAKLFSMVEKEVLGIKGSFVFGSRAYLRFLHNSKLIAFYRSCKRDDLNADFMYHDHGYHPTSAKARTVCANDLDLCMTTTTFDELLGHLKERLPTLAIHKTVAGPRDGSYSTTFASNYDRQSVEIALSLSVKRRPATNISISLDLIRLKPERKSKVTLSRSMGPVPNIWKTICRTSEGYFGRDSFEEEQLDQRLLFLEGCKYLHSSNRTLTTKYNAAVDSSGFLTIEDLIVYVKRLYAEILKAKTQIVNLSISRGVALAALQCALFSYPNDARAINDQSVDLTLEDMVGLIRSRVCLPVDIHLGRIPISECKCVHILCDPDYTTPPELLDYFE